jgi:hypothetical protein
MPLLLAPDPKPFTNYVMVLFRFNHREFTKEGDALNAMEGILRHVSRNLNSGILEGLPTACFDVSLLFWHQFDLPVRRREGFPSWSWAGWSGYTAGWMPENDDLSMQEWIASSTHVVWFKRSATGQVSRVIEKEIRPAAFSNSSPSSANPKSADCPDILGHLGQNTHEYKPSLLEIKFPHSYHLLQFWSYAVKVPRLLTLKYGKTGIIGCNNTVCGALYLDDQNFAARAGPFDLILISKCEKSIGKHWIRSEADQPIYWAMLIETVGIISERRGMGFIYQDQVNFLLPPGIIWSEFILA